MRVSGSRVRSASRSCAWTRHSCQPSLRRKVNDTFGAGDDASSPDQSDDNGIVEPTERRSSIKLLPKDSKLGRDMKVSSTIKIRTGGEPLAGCLPVIAASPRAAGARPFINRDWFHFTRYRLIIRYSLSPRPNASNVYAFKEEVSRAPAHGHEEHEAEGHRVAP